MPRHKSDMVHVFCNHRYVNLCCLCCMYWMCEGVLCAVRAVRVLGRFVGLCTYLTVKCMCFQAITGTPAPVSNEHFRLDRISLGT